MKLPPAFYHSPDVVSIAKQLLGKALFTHFDGEITGGIIVETEAYAGITDRACHSYNDRRTPRTEVMYQSGGIAYVYLCYGIHCLLNCVTGEEGDPKAVLIRAIQPLWGIETMLKRRNKKALDKTLTNGPGALTAALGITRAQNGIPLDSSTLWIEKTDVQVNADQILASPRIGVDYAGVDSLLPYRFQIVKKNPGTKSQDQKSLLKCN